MRRFSDFRFPQEQWSTGDAVTAAISFIAGVVLIVGVVALIASQMPVRY